jgi:tetratricopeptide (TPR) repeat protein
MKFMDKRIKPRSPSNPKKRPNVEKSPEKRPVRKASVTDNPVFLLIVILTLTFIVFLPVFTSDFLTTWDDKSYIIDNMMIRSITFQSLREMFTSQIGGTYVPLPLLSYAIEYKLFGLSSLAFHSTNLLIHLFCTMFVFMILRKLGLKPLFAAIGALIFGIHPMGVESVAWVTERKDLLYTFFYLASIIAYLEYLKKDQKPYLYLLLSLGLFLLALFSKIQAVSLPLVLLAIDFYKKRPIRPNLVVEKIPFFILSLIFGVAGIFILKNIGALRINEIFTFTERLFFGLYTFNAYLIKFIVPVGLSALYPNPIKTGETLPILYYLSPVMIGLLAFATWKCYPRWREIVFGILFFTLSVFFLLQIFGAGQGFMADRYTKIPYVGLVFIVAMLAQNYLEKHRERKTLVLSLVSVILILFMVLSFQRTKVWKNGDTLWSDVIEKYPEKSARPYACRGIYYKEINEQEKALKDFSKDLELDPGDVEILQFRGNIYFNKGKDDSAYADYNRAVKIRQDNALTFANLGAIYVRRNQNDSALYNLSKAISMDSTQSTPYANRAVVYGSLGKPLESIADFKQYLKSKPDDERVLFSVAMIYFNMGNMKECIVWLNKTIAIKPDFANYRWLRSMALKQTGNKTEALKDALKAKELGQAVPDDYLQSLK